jgi:NAD(P)-dependent dehydrogenase (short-subunit alcohol dehydrogenase family)
MIKDMQHMVERVPVGRLGRPEDVADLVAFLCSAHAGFITGEVIDVNGGFLID